MKIIKDKKATFLSRLVAYLIDVFLVAIVSALITYPFINVDKTKDIYQNQVEIEKQYMDKEITKKQYNELKVDVVYQDYKNNGLVYIVTIFLELLYFGLYQFLNKGQTIGKKLLKIMVKSDKGEITMNQLVLRSLIIDSILLNMIVFAFMLFSSKTVFYYSMMIFSILEYLIFIISFIMIKRRKDNKGLHDLMFNTNVVYYSKEMIK